MSSDFFMYVLSMPHNYCLSREFYSSRNIGTLITLASTSTGQIGATTRPHPFRMVIEKGVCKKVESFVRITCLPCTNVQSGKTTELFSADLPVTCMLNLEGKLKIWGKVPSVMSSQSL